MSAFDPGQYNGSISNDGLREGLGNCSWNNGDHYEGDWKDNLRHGNGKFTGQEYTFIG